MNLSPPTTPHMSLENEIQSKSCKDRANAVFHLEKAWLTDKKSYAYLIPDLLKEKNVVVLEQLIPSFKVIPYSDEICSFVIQNFKTQKLKPKILDYLNCKGKQLNIQLVFDNINQKNPRFVESILSYLIEYFKDREIENEDHFNLIKKACLNSDPNVRKNAVELMKIFFLRNEGLDLDGLKPIVIKEIKECRREQSPDNHTSNVKANSFEESQNIEHNSNTFQMSKEQQKKIIDNLNDPKWKVRLDTVEKLNQSTDNFHFLTDEMNKRLKDPNNQVFCVVLEIIKKNNLNFDRAILIGRLADKKLQDKIKKSGIVEVLAGDFENQKNPEILKMLIDICIEQSKRNMKEIVQKFSSSARRDLREKVKEYLDFCENKNVSNKKRRSKTPEIKKVTNQRIDAINSENKKKEVLTLSYQTIDSKTVENLKFYEPISPVEQKNISDEFLYKYEFLNEKDFKKKLEKMQNYELDLIKEKSFLPFVYSIKEHNKMVNMKFLEMLGKSKNIDPILFCHTFVKCFTDNQIFHSFLQICKSLDERKILLFFIHFIRINKKGKLFEKGVEMIKNLQKNVKIEPDIFNTGIYLGKEKQILVNLKKEIEKNNGRESNQNELSIVSDKSIEKEQSVIEESLIQQFESSVILDEQKPFQISPEKLKLPESNVKDIAQKNTNRMKNGKDKKKYFKEDAKTLFLQHKIEASDFIIKFIFEEKKCLCGLKNGTECCLIELIDFYSKQRYILSPYEAEKFVMLIKEDQTLQSLEKIYPKSKIHALKTKINTFKDHLGKSFRIREYNMSPFRKKGKHDVKPKLEEQEPIFPLIQAVPNNSQNAHFVIQETFNNSLINDSFTEPVKCESNEKRESTGSFQKYERFRESFERRLSTNTLNNFLITDLHEKDKSAITSLLQRAKTDLSSLFYIANSLINALLCNFDDPKTIQILMILSADKDFLSEIDFQTMRSLHLEIIKDIGEKGGDIIINLCLNAPVALLMKVYLNILNKNKEIILKLIWRNSKRKYIQHANEILEVFEDFFKEEPVLDDLSFKIIQLHISEIVSAKGRAVLNASVTGQLRRIIEGMIERTKG